MLNDHEVIFAELSRFRIIKVNPAASFFTGKMLQHNGTSFHYLSSCSENGSFYQSLKLKDYSQSGVSIFSEGLPGLPDNVRMDTQASKATNAPFFFIGMGTKSVQPFALPWYSFQSRWLRDFVGKFVSMKAVEKLVPKYGLVVVVDKHGEMVSALHDPSGTNCFISQADRNPVTGDIWFGSHSEPHLGVVSSKNVPSFGAYLEG